MGAEPSQSRGGNLLYSRLCTTKLWRKATTNYLTIQYVFMCVCVCLCVCVCMLICNSGAVVAAQVTAGIYMCMYIDII